MLYSHLKIRTAQLLNLELPGLGVPPAEHPLCTMVNTLTENRLIKDYDEAQCVTHCLNNILTFLEHGANQLEDSTPIASMEIWQGLNQILQAVRVMSLRIEQWVNDEKGRAGKEGQARLRWSGEGEGL